MTLAIAFGLVLLEVGAFSVWLRAARRHDKAAELVKHARQYLQAGASPIRVGARLVYQAQMLGIEREVRRLWAKEVQEFEELGKLVNEEVHP